MRRGAIVIAVVVSTSCSDGNAHGGECVDIRGQRNQWQYVRAEPGYGVAGVSYAIASDAPIMLWEEPSHGLTFEGSSESELRRLSWHFEIASSGYRALRLKFLKPLGGLEFDAVAYTSTGARLTLLDEKRVFSDTVTVSWPEVPVVAVVITAHLHLHRAPSLTEMRVGYRGRLSSVAVLDESFKEDNAVYFLLHRPNRPRLCPGVISTGELPLKLLLGATAEPASLVNPGDAP